MKTVVIGAGPVGALAAIYAAKRGDEVEVYELRPGMSYSILFSHASYICYYTSPHYIAWL